MHDIEIPEAKLNLYVPEHLGQCNKDQYLDFCALLMRYNNGKLTYQDLKVLAIHQFLNLEEPKKSKALLPDVEEKWGNISLLSELIESFFIQKEEQKVIALHFNNNPVPEIKPLWKTYYGPADNFANVTFGEYNDGLRIFLQYAKTGDEQLLYLLAAIFYRRKRKLKPFSKRKEDIREPYKSDMVEERAEVFKSAHPGFVYGFYLFFAAMQQNITQAVIPWGNRELDFSILFDSEPENKEESVPGLGMDSLVFAIAENGEFGVVEQVRNTNLWEILVRLYDLKKREIDQKKQSDAENKST